jgi:hypothetical protein
LESRHFDFGRDPCQNHARIPGHSKQILGGMHGISLELCGIFHMEGIRNFPGLPRFHAQSMLSLYIHGMNYELTRTAQIPCGVHVMACSSMWKECGFHAEFRDSLIGVKIIICYHDK